MITQKAFYIRSYWISRGNTSMGAMDWVVVTYLFGIIPISSITVKEVDNISDMFPHAKIINE